MDVLSRVRRTIRQHNLAGSPTRVVAALSGGSDSVALVHLLAELAKAGDLQFVGLAHFNHRLRASAGADERFCEAIAASLNLPIVTGCGDVAVRARLEHRSVEDAARAARYELFDRVRAELSADLVALGHTRDDQAETFLLRLVRGAGSRGLAGMHPKRGAFIRPLLDCRRADLRAYLDARGAEYVTDETNADVSIPRNRVRAELIPILQDRFNPSIVDALADEAELAREEWHWLGEAAEALRRRICRQEGTVWRLDADQLNAAAAALARAVVHHAMTEAARGRTIAFSHVQAALEVSRGGPPVDAPLQRVHREAGFLVLTGRPEGASGRWKAGAAPPSLFRYPLSIPGEVRLAETGRIVSAEAAAGAHTDITQLRALAQRSRAAVRLDKLHGPLAVRNRRPGDRFRPVGLGGRKKLQDYFVDAKVARAERDDVPLVVDETDQIVWVAGYAIDEEFRVTDPSQGVLILELRQV